MTRRLVTVAMSLLLLVACGEDKPAAAPTPSIPLTSAGARPFEVPFGPDEVVIALTNEGGFVAAGTGFANPPVVLIAGDGRAITTGPVPEGFPGPLLPNVLQRTISPGAVQDLLAEADRLGLLADVEYTRDDRIADAGTTVLVMTVDGTTYRHEAYALGIDEGPDPARDALEEYVAALSDLPTSVGTSELGPEEPLVGDSYLIQARAIEPSELALGDVEPRFVAWPAEAGARLVDAAECAEVPVADGQALFAGADVLTFFTEPDPNDGAEVTYQVSAVPRLPGRSC